MSNRKVTQQDLDGLRYFWEEKGDIERLSTLPEFKEDLLENYPEVWKAWKDYKASIRIVDAVMKNTELKGC